MLQYVYRDLTGTVYRDLTGTLQGPYRDLTGTDGDTDAGRLPIYISRNDSLYFIYLMDTSEHLFLSSAVDHLSLTILLTCLVSPLFTKELYWCFRDTNKEREL